MILESFLNSVKHRSNFNMTEEKDQSRPDIGKKDQDRPETKEKDKNIGEELKEDSLESMLIEQSRSQIRSDYRRSLGNENRRRYME